MENQASVWTALTARSAACEPSGRARSRRARPGRAFQPGLDEGDVTGQVPRHPAPHQRQRGPQQPVGLDLHAKLEPHTGRDRGDPAGERGPDAVPRPVHRPAGRGVEPDALRDHETAGQELHLIPGPGADGPAGDLRHPAHRRVPLDLVGVIAAVAEHHIGRTRDVDGGLDDHRAAVPDRAARGRVHPRSLIPTPMMRSSRPRTCQVPDWPVTIPVTAGLLLPRPGRRTATRSSGVRGREPARRAGPRRCR